MSNYLIVGTGGANVEMGTTGAGYSGIGTIISADREDGGEELELKNRYGNTFAIIFFNDRDECSIDVIFKSDLTIPVRGDSLSLCGLTGVLCKKITHKWEN